MSKHCSGWCFLAMNNGKETLVRLLRTHPGSYVWGESWELNSGCAKITETEESYIVEGFSGSVYEVMKDWEGCLNMSGRAVKLQAEEACNRLGGWSEEITGRKAMRFVNAE